MERPIEISLNTESIEQHRQLFNQTYHLLQMYHDNNLDDPQHAINYFKNHTMPFLYLAARGADAVYQAHYHPQNPISEPELEEAHLARATFTSMHRLLTPERQLLTPEDQPKDLQRYSRRGILQAPQTPEEFRTRIGELQQELLRVVTGKKPTTTDAIHSAWKTREFFNAASILSEHVCTRRQKINQLLKDIPIDF